MGCRAAARRFDWRRSTRSGHHKPATAKRFPITHGFAIRPACAAHAWAIARQYFNISPGRHCHHGELYRADEASRRGDLSIRSNSPVSKSWGGNEFTVLLYEFKADLNAYLAARDAAVKSLADCIAFNNANRASEMPYFEQEIMEQAQAKGPLTDKAYLDALANNLKASRAEGIDAVLAKNNLDAIVAPTGGPAWLTDWIDGDHDKAAALRRPPSPVIRTSPCPPVSNSASRRHLLLWCTLDRAETHQNGICL